MVDRNRLIAFNAPTDQKISIKFKFSKQSLSLEEFLKELPQIFPDPTNFQKIPHILRDAGDSHKTRIKLYVFGYNNDDKWVDSYFKIYVDLSNFKPYKVLKAIHKACDELGGFPEPPRVSAMIVKLPLDYNHFL